MTYSKLQIFLHWFSAAVILWAMTSGFYVAFSDASPSLKSAIGFFNVSITTVLIPFFGLRLYLALANPPPRPTCCAEWAALIAHKAIYATTVIVLATGVLMMDRDIDVFHLATLPHPLSDAAVIAAMNKAHRYACMVLAALLILHVAAVIKHHALGNPVLRKMRW